MARSAPRWRLSASMLPEILFIAIGCPLLDIYGVMLSCELHLWVHRWVVLM